jgi:dolichol-phosphate mannosyltransferase
VGSTGMVADLALFSLLTALFPLPAARALAIWGAMTWNFWLNRELTFYQSRQDQAGWQYLLFCLSCSIGAIINWSTSVSLVMLISFFHNWKTLAAACGIASAATFNYILANSVVFRPK